MTRDELEKIIVATVVSKQGCKATDLVAEPHIAQWHNDFAIPEVIEEMCYKGKLEEIEYILPELNYRTKSFLLPRGTIVSTRHAR